MREKLFKEIRTNINRLTGIIKKVDSQSILNQIADVLAYTGESIFEKTKLSSPYRQCFYLLGLMISNPNIETQKLDPQTWQEICKLLQAIYTQHALIFWPTREEYKDLPPEWWRAREVSMPVFLDYFNTGILAYDEQLIKRIKRWFQPFDQKIYELIGLTVDNTLDIYAWIKEKIYRQLETISDKLEREKRLRLSFIEQWERAGWSLSEARTRVQNHPYRITARQLRNSLVSLFCITKEEMYDTFENTLVENIWKHFVSERTSKDFRFITQENPALTKPLFLISGNKFYSPCVSQFVRAAFEFFLKTLKDSDSEKSFLKHRGKDVVRKATEIFSSYFRNDYVILNSVFERPDSQNEHDIVILYNRNILIVEAKATPPKEPFRNPDKAFLRIKRDFKSNTGIQKAYDQTLGLKKYLLNSSPAILYDKNGKELKRLFSKDFDKIYSICLTADRYGIIAVNLSLLLDKPEDEPFPWSCDLYNLEVLLDGFKNRKPSPDFFLTYLDERARLHEKFYTTDELEIAGFYLQYGSFEEFEKKAGDIFMFTPDASDIFDDIYFKKHGNDYLPYKEHSRPQIIDVREELRRIPLEKKRNRPIESVGKRRIGRNEPCPCGSGKKYKYCHGRHRDGKHGAN